MVVPEEEESLDDANRAFHKQCVAAIGSVIIRVTTIGRRGCVTLCADAAVGAVFVAELWGRSSGARSPFDAMAAEKYNICLDSCEEGCRSFNICGIIVFEETGEYVLADLISNGHSGNLVPKRVQLSLNCNASGMLSHKESSRSVNWSITSTLIMPSLLRICLARIVKRVVSSSSLNTC